MGWTWTLGRLRKSRNHASHRENIVKPDSNGAMLREPINILVNVKHVFDFNVRTSPFHSMNLNTSSNATVNTQLYSRIDFVLYSWTRTFIVTLLYKYSNILFGSFGLLTWMPNDSQRLKNNYHMRGSGARWIGNSSNKYYHPFWRTNFFSVFLLKTGAFRSSLVILSPPVTLSFFSCLRATPNSNRTGVGLAGLKGRWIEPHQTLF